MACSPDEIHTDCLYQIGALQALCAAQGVLLQHVKPHGALYNQAAKDTILAEAIASAVKDAGKGIFLMGLPGTESEKAALAAGVPFASEGFADRAYMKDGSLMPRSLPGAVLHDAAEVARRVTRMVTKGTVIAVDGTEIRFKPDTVCLHGDTPEAVEMAAAVRSALDEAGVVVTPLKDVVSK